MATTVTKRNYVSLAQATNVISGFTLDELDQCEQAIDDYIGHQNKAVTQEFTGNPTNVNGKIITDISNTSQLHQHNGYFSNCVIEIVGGTGKGQVRFISDSNYNNQSVTVVDDWDTAPDATSFYRIYQLAKLPRSKDVLQSRDGLNYYKTIPDAVQQAVLAQVAYFSAKGAAHFVDDQSDIQSENIGNYSYSKKSGNDQSSSVSAVSPRARTLLRGIKNSLGSLQAENPTSL